MLRAWQGLGYNRRALALRRTAQAVVERGGWPDTVEELAALPGVGPYTARAVACFALGLPVAPVDTNVARVLARSLTGADPAQLTPAARQRLADQAMPPDAPWAWSSALMDVGRAPLPAHGRAAVAARWRRPAAGGRSARRRRRPGRGPRRRSPPPTGAGGARWCGPWPPPPTAWTGPAWPTPSRRPPPDGPPAGSTTLLARLETEGMVAEGPDGRLRLPA